MPLYEYFCPPCGHRFDVLRPVSQMDEPAVCPSGHTTNNRVVSLFAPLARSSGGLATMTLPMQTSVGGGCACGGNCACGG